jgi:dimethylhistidine N-methyltransferase
MPGSYEILHPEHTLTSVHDAFALDVLIGLTEFPRRLPSKYFYDAAGSRLFQQITGLSEYYLTQCEHEILSRYRNDIGEYVRGRQFNLIELGPGDAHKTRLLLEHFIELNRDFYYMPIDISESAMRELVDSLEADYPRLKVNGVVSDYLHALNWIKKSNTRRNLILFLGSNIGNFNARASRVFLRSLWSALNDGDLMLVGFDLKKDMELLLAAYNDRRGVTAEFNYNLLRRINRELGADFDLGKFRHFGTYNVFSGAMESYLVSLERQSVFVRDIGQSFAFDPWEPIHTEYSYKYLESDILKLAEETGFGILNQYYDSRLFFADSLWIVRKQKPQ